MEALIAAIRGVRLEAVFAEKIGAFITSCRLRELQNILAALAVRHGQAYPAFDPSSEKPFESAPKAALATAIGYDCFEGMGLIVEA